MQPSPSVRTALVLPWWPHEVAPNERLSLDSLQRFAATDIVVVAPDATCIPPGITPAAFEIFDRSFFSDAWAYSRLLVSAHFYKRFADYDQLIIVQSDVLLLKPLPPLLNNLSPYSYIGAPWGKQDPDGRVHFVGVGNGGFSIRRVSDFIQVLTHPAFPRLPSGDRSVRRVVRWLLLSSLWMTGSKGENMARFILRHFGMHEDIFWSHVASCLSRTYSVAPVREALQFSYEMFPHAAHVQNHECLPFGIHAWWKHDENFVKTLLSLLAANDA